MKSLLKNKNVLGVGLITTFALALLGIVFSQIGNNFLFRTRGNDDTYTLTLDSHNSVSTDGEHVMTTRTGASVRFQYTSVNEPSNGEHTIISKGGSIVNKDVIHSITSFTAVFGGQLQARIAYTTNTWGEYFDLTSGQTITLGSHPYYLEMKATNSGVSLYSATYGYSCQVNQDAEEQDSTGSYTISFTSGSSDESEIKTNLGDYISEGASLVSDYTCTKVFGGKGTGIKLGSGSATGSLVLEFNFDSSTLFTNIAASIAQYGTDSGQMKMTYNGQTGDSVTVSPSTGSISKSLNSIQLNELKFETTSKRAYLLNITLSYGTKTEPGVPAKEEVGFTATDNNKDTYSTNSIYNNDNGLVVSALYSDSSTTTLTKGENGYSYVVKNQQGLTIDSSAVFGSEGEYTAIISYKNYIPVEIQFTVGEYIYIEDIAASMNEVTFTTADTLSTHLVGNLSAVVTYSNGSTKTVQYNSFATENLGVKLLTPKGITHNQSNPFGVEGQWTVRVYRLDDENIIGDFNITVNAIPVQTITLNKTTYELYPEDTLQLVATVNPTTATNSLVYWLSSNEDVATVDDDGLVTAVAVGGATITATAADGSGVYGQCVITVNPKPATTDVNIDATTTSQVTTNSTSTVVFTNSPVTVTIAKSSSSTNANNYVASGSDPHTRVYASQRFTISAGDNPISKIVIHGTGDKGVGGFTSPTWTNATKSSSGNEVTLTPTDPDSDVYCTISATSSFSGITVTIGSGSSATPIYPTSIALSGNNTISIGETSQLSVTYTPNDTNVKNVTFTSSNSSVASVSSEGLVTGVAQGSATITATAKNANNQNITATISITVNPIAVTSVSLNPTSVSIKAGKTTTLVPTINPNNASNKNVTWSTSNSSIATVSNGVVTGVSAGNATITVTTQDGNKTATCSVTVTAGSAASAWELVTNDSSLAAGDVLVIANYSTGVTAGNISSQVMSHETSTFSSDHSVIEELGEDTVQLTLGGSEGNWTLANDAGELLGATAVKKLAWDSGTTTWDISISSENATIQSTTSSYGRFLCNTGTPRFTTYTSATSSSMLLPQLYRGGTAEPINPTSILMSKSSVELSPGGSTNLSVSYVPNNANQNKDVTWTSSNTNVATVDSTGKVSVKSTATVGQTATITATLTNLTTIKATCTVTVIEQQLDDHTVMIYMCGADLESKNGLASGDIDEILKVTGQPDDVNIIIETGGANSWDSGHSYSIDSSKLERWHVENKKLVKDDSLTYASMGLTSTFQNFLEWGLTNYPAERTGVILWNHGGGMHGVCYDEKKSDDSLLNSEVKAAVGNAFASTGRSTSNKLEWIGYDACLMSVQDIAEFNSAYFNYQISSEESEAGYGWDYDNWVDNLYNKQSTTTILKEICDTFIKDNGGVNSSSGDQTLSYLNLSYMAAYKTAWENMATQLKTKLTSSNKSAFNTAIINNVKHYADSDYDYFCLFDAKDFVNKLSSHSSFSSFRIDSSYTNAVINAHGNLVAYSTCQKGAGNSYGLCMYWTNNSQYSYISTYYTTTQTNFTVWQGICNTYGTHR